MDRTQFESLLMQALEELPQAFKDKLENIDIVIEEQPDMHTVRTLGVGARGHLLGLYRGVPLKNRTHYYGMVMPDKITLYKSNIERASSQSGLGIAEQIRRVLQHEIAHHFGITDKRLKDLGTY
jgi:predicted Zn-dependent protease with MMP-like domain